MNERELRLLLASLGEPGDEKVGALISEFGIDEAFELARQGDAGGALCKRLSSANLVAHLSQMERATVSCGSRFITPDDDEWPIGLSDLEFGEPIGLWVIGKLNLGDIAGHSVAVVGARSSTSYGERVASDLGSLLAMNSVTSVSGAAYGIDAAVHRGSLAANGPTIAVLACGVDVAYPTAHKGLLDRIAEHGLIVSEAPPGTKPHKHRFLIRNRLIAAMSQSTVVVEAALRSGSLSTSMWAHGIGRQVWGIPGPLTSATSAGVHAAIRDGVMDIVTDLKAVVPAVQGDLNAAVSQLSDDEFAIVDLLTDKGATTDAVVQSLSASPAHEVLANLTLLEVKGIVTNRDGVWSVS